MNTFNQYLKESTFPRFQYLDEAEFRQNFLEELNYTLSTPQQTQEKEIKTNQNEVLPILSQYKIRCSDQEETYLILSEIKSTENTLKFNVRTSILSEYSVYHPGSKFYENLLILFLKLRHQNSPNTIQEIQTLIQDHTPQNYEEDPFVDMCGVVRVIFPASSILKNNLSEGHLSLKINSNCQVDIYKEKDHWDITLLIENLDFGFIVITPENMKKILNILQRLINANPIPILGELTKKYDF